jgi:hypothetical protein
VEVATGVVLLVAILGAWWNTTSRIDKLAEEIRHLAERVARIEGRLDERDHHSSP